MPEVLANGVRLHYEELGEGAPILCIHGTGSSALVWSDALRELARLGRAIAYDRRGCARSERPEPYERTVVAEHGDDAAALLDALEATPAVVIGRSYGGEVALDLALRHPGRARALALLEGAPAALSPAAAEWSEGLDRRISEAAAETGVDAAGEALIDGVLGPDGWRALPQEVREIFTGNGPAILAEARGGGMRIGAADLAALDLPVLVAAAADSPPAFREAARATAEALPRARFAKVGGGHLIDPAGPEVMGFIREVLDRR